MERGGYRGRGGGRRGGDAGRGRYGDRGGRGREGRGRGRGGGQHYHQQQQQPQPRWDRSSGGGRVSPQSPSWAAVAAPKGSGEGTSGGGSWGGSSSRSTSDHVGHIAEKVQAMDIAEQRPISSSTADNRNRLVPIGRPDKGGTLAKKIVNLRVNHFPIKFNSESTIRHYDIDIKPDASSSVSRPVRIPKYVCFAVREKFFLDNPEEFPLQMTAFDGQKNIFSATSLSTGVFKLEFSEAEDVRSRAYTITIKLVNELKLCKLESYLSGQSSAVPRDILQGMDVVMKENPSRHMISLGRNFYSAELREEDDLGGGIAASRGFQHSLKPTAQGLSLCLDYSILAFRKPLPVLHFLREHIHYFNINDFHRYRKQVEEALRGLKVTVIHRTTKQKYTIAGLTREPARHLSFSLEDPEGNSSRNIGLVQYFREKYGRDIEYENIPCLNLGRNNKQNYVPMEFCVLLDGQRYPKEDLDKEAQKFLKSISLAPPDVRERNICDMVRAQIGPCGGEVTNNFGLEVNMNVTAVTGRVIGAPDLRVGSQRGTMTRITVDREKCQWNLVNKSVAAGTTIMRWAILDFSSQDRKYYLKEGALEKLIARCRNLGIHMEAPLVNRRTSMRPFHDLNNLHYELETVTKEAYQRSGQHLQIIICVMSATDPGYKYLKWLSETQVGVVTQCCLSGHVNLGKDQYLANLALKINAKLGGSNVELNDQLPRYRAESPVMFIGADVNHPSPQNTSSPSIAAVVATMNWPAANRYAARVRPQAHRKEQILQFGEMCLDLVKCYEQQNKEKPQKIVLFRDGVSDSQFDMALNDELFDLKRAFGTADYNPTITLIVAQKRHQTRLFQESGKDGNFACNVLPGTVVDTKIIHPFEFDFYLCSHYGSIGTSKPTHYHVLLDEHRFSSDELQKLIYHMCFTFARCTKPVSLVPPVYYADLAAYRGRLYYEAVVEGRVQPSTSSSHSSLDSSFFKLHDDLQNIMFFV